MYANNKYVLAGSRKGSKLVAIQVVNEIVFQPPQTRKLSQTRYISHPLIPPAMDSSPFASRLDSNYIATDSESLEIKILLEHPTARLEELSTQLQELRDEQSALLLFISKHRTLISAIRKLPIDVLQKIFVACLPTAHNPVMSKSEPPILLTQICSSWRNVAHATPQLWKSIHIAIPFSKYTTVEQHMDRRSEVVQEWLTRSAACPLDISVGGDWETRDVDESCDKIIDTLIRFSERWREVCFLAPYQALVPIASLPPSKVPLLKAVSLNCPSPDQVILTQLDPQSVCGLLKAPNLRDLSLLGWWLTHLSVDVTRLPINWNQLTNIVLEGPSCWGECFLSVSGTYKILSLCRNLITCQLEIGSLISEDIELPLDATAAIISLPSLTRLSVCENTSLKRLFTLLHLPSLNFLEFRTTISPTEQSSTSLLSLLTRFHNTIHLITDSQYFTRQDFIKCLRLCPLLKSLSIQKAYYVPPGIPSCKIDDAFIQLFFESSNDEGCLCPRLEIFKSSRETELPETTLLQFVKEKNGDSTPGLAKLKCLNVTFNRRPLSDIDLNQELEPYKQAGLATSIMYLHSSPSPFSESAFDGLPEHVFYGFLPVPDYLPPY